MQLAGCAPDWATPLQWPSMLCNSVCRRGIYLVDFGLLRASPRYSCAICGRSAHRLLTHSSTCCDRLVHISINFIIYMLVWRVPRLWAWVHSCILSVVAEGYNAAASLDPVSPKGRHLVKAKPRCPFPHVILARLRGKVIQYRAAPHLAAGGRHELCFLLTATAVAPPLTHLASLSHGSLASWTMRARKV